MIGQCEHGPHIYTKPSGRQGLYKTCVECGWIQRADFYGKLFYSPPNYYGLRKPTEKQLEQLKASQQAKQEQEEGE